MRPRAHLRRGAPLPRRGRCRGLLREKPSDANALDACAKIVVKEKKGVEPASTSLCPSFVGTGTMSAVAQASASAQVRATTVAEAGDLMSSAPPRVHRVRKVPAVHLNPVTVVAGGGDGRILQREDRMGFPALRVRRFDSDVPCLAARPEASCARLAIDPDEAVGNPVIAQGLDEPVDAVAVGDAIEVKPDRFRLAHLVPIERQDFMRPGGAGLPSLRG